MESAHGQIRRERTGRAVTRERVKRQAKDSDALAAAPEPAARLRRAYLPAKERRALIIEAAQQVFARSNLQGARTRDIAKAAAVNPATVFEHFESKEALFHAAVVEPLMDAMRGMHDRAQTYESAESLDEMRKLARVSAQRQIEIMVDIFPLFTAAMFSDLELGKKLYRDQIKPILKERSAAIRRLVKPGLDADLVEVALFGMTFALAMDQTLGGSKKDIADLADHLTHIALTGFASDVP
jgi:AcrR family transcriptional regulator